MNPNVKNVHIVTSLLVTAVTFLVLSGLGWLLGGKGDTASAITPAQQSAIEQHVADLLTPLLPKAGALSSPAIGAWFSYGDIVHDGNSANVDFTGTATSTACSVQSPAATSTLSRATLRIATEPYVSTWKIGKSVGPGVVTTLLAQGTGNGLVIATTTNTTLTDSVVSPLSYINFIVSTTTPVNANFNATVHCEASFVEL